MKILAALMILASAAFAQASSGDVTYDWPSVNGLSINNACATETTFRSLTPVSYCAETKVDRYSCRMGEMEYCRPLKAGEFVSPGEYLKEQVTCVAYGKKNIEVPRTVKTSKCVESAPIDEAHHGECLKWAEVETFVGTEFSVPMYQEQGDIGQVLVGYKKFTVPACN